MYTQYKMLCLFTTYIYIHKYIHILCEHTFYISKYIFLFQKLFTIKQVNPISTSCTYAIVIAIFAQPLPVNLSPRVRGAAVSVLAGEDRLAVQQNHFYNYHILYLQPHTFRKNVALLSQLLLSLTGLYFLFKAKSVLIL